MHQASTLNLKPCHTTRATTAHVDVIQGGPLLVVKYYTNVCFNEVGSGSAKLKPTRDTRGLHGGTRATRATTKRLYLLNLYTKYMG